MADYVVRFTGQDNLSGTIKNIKNELNNTGNTASKLDQIRDKFNRINNSSAPLKKQLRDIQALMAQMNLNGLSGSEEFTEAAARAGQLKDAIADAAQATRLLSSDTAGLDAGIQALQGLSGAAGVATGVMGLLGVENEKTQQAILKVQSVLSIMNGVQQVANVLNKDSILMLKLKQIWQNASAASTTKETVATTANTVATAANTAGTVANTTVKQAWNVVTAISKALLGDFTGLILVGAGALATYAIATSGSTDKIDEHNQSLQEAKKRQQEYTDAVATNAGQLVGKYQLLRNEWNNLKTTGEKVEWIKTNANAFRDLGLKVYDLKSAEDVFVNNTSNMVKALEARARAMAAQNMLVKSYERQYSEGKTRANGYFRNNAKVGQNFRNDSELRKYGLVSGKDYIIGRTGQQNTLTSAGAAKLNAKYSEEARKKNQQWQQSYNDERQGYINDINTSNQTLKGLNVDVKVTPTGGGHSSSGGSHSGGGTTETSAPSGSLKDLNNQLQVEEAKLKLVTDPADSKAILANIENLKQQIEDKEITLGIKENPLVKGAKVESADLSKMVDLDIEAPTEKLKGLENLTYSYIDAMEALKEKQQNLVDIANAAQQTGQAFADLGNAIGGTAGQAIGAFGQIAATIAQTIGQVISMMMAQGVSSAMALPFPANLAAAATVMAGLASIIATIKSAASGGYADGGIISGNSFHGDKLLARVNAGEMILNQKQQANLFHQLNSSSGIGGGQVEFKISGSALKGVLRNYDNKMSKVK